jgi:hypothetical protein
VLLTLLLTTVAVAVPDVAVELVVGLGNDNDLEGVARLQNCWASCSVEFNKVGQVTDIHDTIAGVNFPLRDCKEWSDSGIRNVCRLMEFGRT